MGGWLAGGLCEGDFHSFNLITNDTDCCTAGVSSLRPGMQIAAILRRPHLADVEQRLPGGSSRAGVPQGQPTIPWQAMAPRQASKRRRRSSVGARLWMAVPMTTFTPGCCTGRLASARRWRSWSIWASSDQQSGASSKQCSEFFTRPKLCWRPSGWRIELASAAAN